MRLDLNTCSSQSVVHHGVPVRILSSVVGAPQQKRQQQQHILEPPLTYFFSYSYLGRTRNFSEGSVQKHTSPCSFRKRVGGKRKKTPSRTNQQYVSFSFGCGIVYSSGNRTPESEKKQTSVYLIKRKTKKKMLVRVYVPGTYIRSTWYHPLLFY